MQTKQYWAHDEILIVDDDAMQRELMKLALADFGLPVREAANGLEALQMFREFSPMLVVMDIHMPVMDGYEACTEMKRTSGASDAAIVLITGMEDLAAVQTAYDVGAIEFITKPLDWPLFQLRIKYIIRIQQSFLRVQESRQKLAWAQRAARFGSWDLDRERPCLAFSEEASVILGLEAAEPVIPVAALKSLLRPRDRRALIRSYCRLLRADQPLDLDISLAARGGHQAIVHVHGEKVPLDEGFGVSGTVQDITAQRVASERVREAADLKNQFLANISHEMRTPINGVLGMADLLIATDLAPEQAQWVGYISDSARHLKAVVNDVLDFSSIEAGSLRVEAAPFEARRAIEATTALVAALARQQDLEVVTEVDDDVPRFLVGDQGRISQVLLNLLGNALKFTEYGTVTVRVNCLERAGNRLQVRFAVRDTGIGIPLEKQDIVFEQFMQVDGSLTRQRQGTGLGLTISRELVQRMGGRIELSSQEGEGTEVWFVLPLTSADTKEAALNPEAAPAALSGAERGTIRVLLVEDNKINRVIARKVLDRLGFAVEEAADGRQALARVQADSFDIVLMDCQMPVMDGYEATRRIRELGGRYRDLPIIALTAHALNGDREKCLAAGMNDYASKPIEGQAMVELMGKWAEAAEPAVSPV